MLITLHVGIHKTGSTSTYDLLVQNQDLFPSEFRTFHNRTPEIEPIKSAAAAFMLRPTESAKASLVKELANLVMSGKDSGGKHLLISSAGLAGELPKPWRDGGKYQHLPLLVKAMIDSLPDDTVEVVIVTREEKRWIKSMYAHQLRTRGIRFTECGFFQLFEPAFSFDKIVESVRKTGALVHHVRFEEDIKARLGAGNGVLKACGFAEPVLEKWTAVERRNTGVPKGSLELVGKPWTFLLPRLVRKEIVKIIARRTKRKTP